MNTEDRRTVLFTSAAHGLVHTYELAIPILMTVWLAEFSTTAAALGLVVTVGYGLFGVGSLPGGALVDRFGSRRLILVCVAGMAGSFLLASAAPSLGVLAVAIAAWGIAASVYHPAGLALLSKSVERPGTALGYHGIGGNVGIAVGPLVVAVLLLWFDWRLVAAVLAVPAFAVVAYGLLVREEIDTGTGRGVEADGGSRDWGVASVVADTRVLMTIGFVLVLVVVTLNGLYYRAFLTFLPELLDDALPWLSDVQLFAPDSPQADQFDPASYLYAMILMVGVFGQYVGGRLADRFRPERALAAVVAGLSLLAAAFIPASATLPTFLAVSMLLGVALFTIQPLSQATVASYSAPEMRGLSYGFSYLSIFGIGALGAGVAGAVLTHGSPAALFGLLAVLAAISATVCVTILRVGEPRS